MTISRNKTLEGYKRAIAEYEGLESSFSSTEAGYSSLHARRKIVHLGLENLHSLIEEGKEWFDRNQDLPERRLAFRIIYNKNETALGVFELAEEFGLSLDYSYRGYENIALGLGLNSLERKGLNMSDLQTIDLPTNKTIRTS
jgi:hypothetical protein